MRAGEGLRDRFECRADGVGLFFGELDEASWCATHQTENTERREDRLNDIKVGAGGIYREAECV